MRLDDEPQALAKTIGSGADAGTSPLARRDLETTRIASPSRADSSINLADDAQLLKMMREANFFVVFIGIESSNVATLIAMQKKQNTRRSLEESVSKIYGAGIFVLAGFIVGFDSEREGVSGGMIDCIQSTSIPICMVGLLTALANTQMSR